MGRALLAAEQQLSQGAGDQAFLEAKVTTAHFYATHILVKTSALREEVLHGAAPVMALPQDRF